MNFVLYSINYAPELTAIGKYNAELTARLEQFGVHTDVVTAQPYYPEWEIHRGYRNWWTTEKQSESVTIHRCPLYVPKKVTTLTRLLHLFSFVCCSAISMMKLWRTKPDIVMLVQPTLLGAPLVLMFCWITGAKSLMHVQDFEVDAMVGLGMGSVGRFGRFAARIERWLMRKFDAVSSISYSMLDKARAKGVDPEKLFYFPNWIDTDLVTPYVSGDKIRRKWKIHPNDKVVIYSGNIGKKQGLEIILEAAQHFLDRTNLVFIIIGSGAFRTNLESIAENLKLTNVFFKPLQPWKDVPHILSMADVNLVVQRKNISDVVMPSKLITIMAAGGCALVTAEASSEIAQMAHNNPGLYDVVEPEDAAGFIRCLEECLARNNNTYNQVAREYVEGNFSEGAVISRFYQNLRRLVNGEKVASDLTTEEASMNRGPAG